MITPSSRPRRFYKTVTTAPAAEAEGYAVLLDEQRPVRGPSRGVLRLPTAALAEAVADEWRAQGETVDPSTMPLTQLANTALVRVAADREGMLSALLGFVDTDVLCYRADAPPDLAARQAAAWQPVLDWAEGVFAARMEVTIGVMPVRQPPDTVEAVRRALDAMDDWALTGVQCVAGAAGSVILALAVAHGHLDGETCHAVSRLDETWQMEEWGEDREALRAREAARRDILAAERLITLARA